MADLTEEDVTLLDGLLRFYIEWVYLPEAENAYRRHKNIQAKRLQQEIDKIPAWQKALADPIKTPELIELADTAPSRKQFEALVKDEYTSVLVALFRRAGLRWSPELDESQGRVAAIGAVMAQWSSEEWGTSLIDPKNIEWDPVVADALPSGRGFIGPQSSFEAAVRSENVQRALQTLDNIAGGLGGAIGFAVGGDEGSDIGAAAEGMLPGGGRGRSRSGRAAKRNAAKARRGTQSRGTQSRGTGSRGTGNPAAGSTQSGVLDNALQVKNRRKTKRRQRPTGTDQPTPEKGTTPDKPPEKQKPNSADRAAARASSAEAAARGDKLTPKVRSKLVEDNVNVDDAYTREKLNDIFATNRSDDALLVHARANSGEFRALIREGRMPKVKSVRFLRPKQDPGARTPDIEVTKTDGKTEFVEVRTLTGASRGAEVKDAKKQRRPVPAEYQDSVEDKIQHGQISAQNPGKIVFHAPFQPITATSLEGWREMLATLRKRKAFPKGLRRIEVTGAPDTDGTTRMLVFEPPDWSGVSFK